MKKEQNQIRFYFCESMEIVEGRSVHSFPPHSHASYCIGLITDGTAILKINQQQFVMNKESVYFIPPYTEHALLSVDGKPYRYRVICIKDKALYGCRPKQYVLTGETALKMIHAIERFQETADNQSLIDTAIELAHSNRKPENSFLSPQVRRMAQYIEENLEEPFDVKKLCGYAHLTQYHLLRIFKKQMGIAPYHFYVQKKIQKIRQGLMDGQPAADLAYEYHFTDQSHLCNCFKRQVGLTPEEYKRAVKSLTEAQEQTWQES